MKFYFLFLLGLCLKTYSVTYTATGCPGPVTWSGFGAGAGVSPFYNGATHLVAQPAAGSILIIPVGCTVTITGVPTQVNNAITLKIDGVLRFAQSPAPPSILLFTAASNIIVGSSGVISSAGTSGASEITFSSGDKWQAVKGSLNGPATISNACSYVGGSPPVWSPAGCGATLPIELIDFTGTCISNGVQLSWSTATEKNNNYFLIESSLNGYDWLPVTKVKGSRISETTKHYSFLDKTKNYELTYYRLSQVDDNGQSAVFRAIDINCKINSIDQMVLFPNPASKELNVLLNVSSSSSNNTIRIINNFGQVVIEKTVDLIKGLNTIILPVEISSGSYSIIVSSDMISIPSQKLIIMN